MSNRPWHFDRRLSFTNDWVVWLYGRDLKGQIHLSVTSVQTLTLHDVTSAWCQRMCQSRWRLVIHLLCLWFYMHSSVELRLKLDEAIRLDCWGRIDLLSDSAPVGGHMSHSAGSYQSFFGLAKQATNKLVCIVFLSSFLPGFPQQLHAVWVLGQRRRGDYRSRSERSLRPVRVRLRRIHAGVIQLPISLSGCVGSTLWNSI